MKRFLTFLLSVILISTFALPVFAISPDEVNNTYENVYDIANLLSDEEESELSTMASDYSSKNGVKVVFLTYDDAEGKSTMTYTDDFYDALYYDADGILFAIDMDNREMYINTIGSCINALSDSEREIVLDKYAHYVSSGSYYNFFENACEESFNLMSSTNSSTPSYNSNNYYDSDDDYKSENKWYVPTLASLIVTLFVMIITAVVLLSVHNKANKQISATNYFGDRGYVPKNRREQHIRTYETVSRNYYRQSSSSSSSRGGSSSHRSSSGVRHGGGGRRF